MEDRENLQDLQVSRGNSRSKFFIVMIDVEVEKRHRENSVKGEERGLLSTGDVAVISGSASKSAGSDQSIQLKNSKVGKRSFYVQQRPNIHYIT